MCQADISLHNRKLKNAILRISVSTSFILTMNLLWSLTVLARKMDKTGGSWICAHRPAISSLVRETTRNGLPSRRRQSSKEARKSNRGLPSSLSRKASHRATQDCWQCILSQPTTTPKWPPKHCNWSHSISASQSYQSIFNCSTAPPSVSSNWSTQDWWMSKRNNSSTSSLQKRSRSSCWLATVSLRLSWPPCPPKPSPTYGKST